MVKHRHRQRELFVSIIRTLLRTISTVIRIIGTIDGILGTLYRETDRIDRPIDRRVGRKEAGDLQGSRDDVIERIPEHLCGVDFRRVAARGGSARVASCSS
jgi:hypothetical protein